MAQRTFVFDLVGSVCSIRYRVFDASACVLMRACMSDGARVGMGAGRAMSRTKAMRTLDSHAVLQDVA
eukprot:939505-Rhodomonas_salina.2